MTNPPAHPAAFDGIVALSRGVKPIANRGRVVVTDSHVELYDTKGQLVAAGPAAEVWAKKRLGTWGSGLSLWVGGAKYTVSPGANTAVGLATGSAASKVARGRAFSRALLAALTSAGAHVGKPPANRSG